MTTGSYDVAASEGAREDPSLLREVDASWRSSSVSGTGVGRSVTDALPDGVGGAAGVPVRLPAVMKASATAATPEKLRSAGNRGNGGRKARRAHR